jgi:hypothetical protein
VHISAPTTYSLVSFLVPFAPLTSLLTAPFLFTAYVKSRRACSSNFGVSFTHGECFHLSLHLMCSAYSPFSFACTASPHLSQPQSGLQVFELFAQVVSRRTPYSQNNNFAAKTSLALQLSAHLSSYLLTTQLAVNIAVLDVHHGCSLQISRSVPRSQHEKEAEGED